MTVQHEKCDCHACTTARYEMWRGSGLNGLFPKIDEQLAAFEKMKKTYWELDNRLESWLACISAAESESGNETCVSQKTSEK